jgi:hypothetical protein
MHRYTLTFKELRKYPASLRGLEIVLKYYFTRTKRSDCARVLSEFFKSYLRNDSLNIKELTI